MNLGDLLKKFSKQDSGQSELAAFLEKNGAPKELVQVVKESKGKMVIGSIGKGDVHEKIFDAVAELQGAFENMSFRIRSLETLLVKMSRFLEMPPNCNDSVGTKLQVGDRLTGGSLDSGEHKAVLGLAFSMAQLTEAGSRKVDGWWTEDQIKERGWVIDKEHALNKKV